MKNFWTIILLNLLTNTLNAQSKYYILDSAHTGSHDYVARDSVVLKPGFSYAATAGNTFTANVDEDIILSVDYDDLISPDREIDTSLPVGSTTGNFEVTSTGAASYAIPLIVPPGTAGLEPQISIMYNSQGGSGTMGYGWDVAGLSAISRVGRAHYMDEKVTTVELNDTDRFALDGNRLVLTNEFDYGSDGSVYHTELENFNEIIAHGTAGAGPQWFEVITKDGETLEYGHSEDSRIKPVSGNTPYMWRLNKIKDIHGNYIRFEYLNRDGESVIKRISYTGFEGGEEPYNEIVFSYEERQDTRKHFIKGKSITQKLLLYKIKVLCEGVKVIEYHFDYNYNYFITRLIQINECAGNGKKLNSTIIEWGDVSLSFDKNNIYINDNSHLYTIGDFNNDGKDDFIRIPDKETYTSNDKWELFLNDNGTDFIKADEGDLMDGVIKLGKRDEYIYRKNNGLQYLDFNGDGLMDMLINQFHIDHTCSEYCSNDCFEFSISDGNGLASLVDPFYPRNYNYNGFSPKRTKVIFGDFNGNGKTNYQPYKIDSTHFLYNFDIIPLDYNGDGITDLMCINKNTNFDIEDACIIYDGKSEIDFPYLQDNIITESTNELSHGGFPTKWHRIFPGEFNGDGKLDLLTFSPDYGWLLAFSHDAGGYEWPFTSMTMLQNVDPEYSPYNNHIFVQDINGDGLSDIVEIYEIYSGVMKFCIHYNLGNGSFITEENNYNFNFPFPIFKHIHFGDFNGDGKVECFISKTQSQSVSYIIRFHPDETSHLVKSITNGFNSQYQIEYKTLADQSVYLKGTEAPFPVIRDIQMPVYVVSSTQQNDSNGGFVTIDYNYEEALLHSLGRGFLGFKKTVSSSEGLNFRNISINSLNASKGILLPYSNETRLYNNNLISKKDYKYSIASYGSRRFQVRLDTIFETDFLNNIVSETIIKYDALGNDTLIINSIGNDVIIETRKQYEAFNTDYDNRLIFESVYKKYDDELPFVIETEYEYFSNGTLKKIIKHPETNYAVNTNYLYTNRGMVSSESVSADGLPTRTHQFEYDNRQRFVKKTINPEGFEENKNYDPKTGSVTYLKDYNGHASSFEYDAFGILVKTIDSRGHQITKSLSWTDNPEIPLALYCQEVSIPGRPDERRYYDILGREIRYENEGRKGSVYSEKVYNSKGQLISESIPDYLSCSEPDRVFYSYDVYGRIYRKVFQDDTTSYSYGQKSKTTTNISTGQSVTEYYNDNGDIIRVTDEGGEVTYIYHSSGQMKEINYGSHTVTIGYNEIGQQESLNDPNSGEITYDYNAYGQLTSQEDANNNTYSMVYDIMGRLLTKTGPEGTTSYSYFTGSVPLYKYGLLSSVTGSNNISESYDYNQYGELTSRVEIIQGESFSYSYQYDSYGNVIQETYPSGVSVTNEYDSKGFPEKITKNPGNIVIWEFIDEDKPGMITDYTRGPGLNTAIEYDEKGFPSNFLTSYQSTIFQDMEMVFDPSTGNLLSRVDNRRQLTESFQYDKLDRLTHAAVTGGVQLNMDYTANGNILFKNDAGDYSYHPVKSNAVLEIINNPLTIPLTEQEIDYTPFNKAWQISEDGKELTIIYGPDQQRRKSVYTESSLERTTIYGINYERVTVPGSTKHIYYLHSPTGLAAVVIKGGTEDVYFTTTDHLGSITGLIDVSCQNLVEEYSFDAWGRRRNPVNWTYDNVPTSTFLTRGFTGHEHLYTFGLINMNGRMYDPVLARFLSPDNYVQMPFSTQGYNRYSYCLNNPLKFSDPDGEWIITLLFMLGNAYFNGVMANNMQFNPLKWEPNLKTFYAIGSGLLTGYSIGSEFEEMVEGFLVNKKFQRDVSNGMLENYSAEELYTKNYFDVRYGDSFLGPINSNAIYNDKILYKGKIIPIRNNEYNFKLSEGIGVQSSSRVEGFLAYDGHYVTGSAQVLRNQEHLNLTYNANITLRDGEKIIDVFRLTKTNNEIFISSYYKYLGSVTFAVPKQKSSYFLDFFIGFEGYKNLSFFNGKLYNQTFLFIP